MKPISEIFVIVARGSRRILPLHETGQVPAGPVRFETHTG